MSKPTQSQSDVLSQVSEFIARYLQCSEHQRTVLALWVLHTYCFPAAQVTPYLSIRSAHKQSGKTLCLQLLALLCEGSALTSGGFKASDLAWPMHAKPISALLLDECHPTIGTRSRSKGPTLRALFAGSFHLLHGHSNIAQERNAFCPKALAGQGPLPEELADRSIPIILEPLKIPSPLDAEPAAPTQKNSCASETAALSSNSGDFGNSGNFGNLPQRFHLRHAIDQVQPIRKRLNHWADVHLLPLLDKMSPLPRSAFPPNLSPRQQDIVEPLLQIAGLIGGPWPHRAIQAFAIIFDLQTHFDLLPNLQLLADARNCFAHYGDPQHLSTADLQDWLHSLPARPWDGDGPFTPHKLARLLRPFAIRPRNQRVSSTKTVRGYQLKDFQEPWRKYFDCAVPQSEIANKACPRGEPASRRDGLCSTVSLDADPAVSPEAGNPKSEIENLESTNPGAAVSNAGAPASDDQLTLACPRGELAQPKECTDDRGPQHAPGLRVMGWGDPMTRLAASSQQLEAQTSEIVNKDAVCSTASLGGTRSSLSPAAGPGVPWVTSNLFPGLITCSPECELETGSAAKLENQSHDLANLSTQQIRERKEALMRELSPLFSKPVPLHKSKTAQATIRSSPQQNQHPRRS